MFDINDINIAEPIEEDGQIVVFNIEELDDTDLLDDHLLFPLQTNNGVIGIPMNTVLQFLRIIEDNGYVPPLSQDWWNLVINMNGYSRSYE